MVYSKGLCHQDIAFYANKGPSILHQGGGWGLVGFEGDLEKNMALKKDSKEKNSGFKGESPKTSFKF